MRVTERQRGYEDGKSEMKSFNYFFLSLFDCRKRAKTSVQYMHPHVQIIMQNLQQIEAG